MIGTRELKYYAHTFCLFLEGHGIRKWGPRTGSWLDDCLYCAKGWPGLLIETEIVLRKVFTSVHMKITTHITVNTIRQDGRMSRLV